MQFACFILETFDGDPLVVKKDSHNFAVGNVVVNEIKKILIGIGLRKDI